MSYGTLGRLLLGIALLLALAGLALVLLDRFGIDRLPGDIVWKPDDNVTIFIPLGLMILLSLVLTIVLNLILRR